MRLTSVLLSALLIVTLVGCAVEGDPRPVTTQEAETLAIARLQNFTEGSRAIETTIVENDAELRVAGWVDYVSHIGYVTVTGEGFAPQALLWTEDRIGISTAEPDADGMPPLPIISLDDPTWTSRPLDPAGSALDALVVAIGNLGSDRPENPLLLQQSGAWWLRTDSVDGVPVTVFAAPPSDEALTESDPPVTEDTSPLRLWVDSDGLPLRVELRSGDDWTTVDYTGEGPDLTL